MSSSSSSNNSEFSRKRKAERPTESTANTQQSSKLPRTTTNTNSKPATKNENISKYFTKPRASSHNRSNMEPNTKSLFRPISPSARKPTRNKSNSNSKSNPNPSITLSYKTGSLFSAPKGTLLIHACNCEGTWGGGIALAFRKTYPLAYRIYADHCAKFKGRMGELRGRGLVITPQGQAGKGKGGEGSKGHWIGCVFTSVYKGKRKDGVKEILESTKTSMEDLMKQVSQLDDGVTNKGGKKRDGEDDAKEIDDPQQNKSGNSPITSVRMCKINSGLFDVEWERTVEVLEGLEIAEGHPFREIEVWERGE